MAETYYSIQDATLDGIADAIRSKLGTSTAICAEDFADKIDSISSVKYFECEFDTSHDMQGIVSKVEEVQYVSLYVDKEHQSTKKFVADQNPFTYNYDIINVKDRVDSLSLADGYYTISLICRASGYEDKMFVFYYEKISEVSTITNSAV